MATRPSAVVVGHDHRFGYRGQGDVTLLGRVLAEQGIGVEIVPEFVLHDAPVRSTRVRERLLLGHVARAAELLGRRYRLGGTVVSGTGTGHHIGFPTLNLRVDELEKLVPADGVYAVLVDLPGTSEAPYLGVLNIGHRPTFRGEKRTIEVHVLDRELPETPPSAVLSFVERLRPERRFSSPESLAKQIAVDANRARELLRGTAEDRNP
jgi:riboflavin kinase/FMN adenylyltransferase